VIWQPPVICLTARFRRFHDPPWAAQLDEYAPGGVELGYTIFAPYRRQGYATEAANALMTWAQAEHKITRFVVSISPQNLPSLALAARLGFHKVGTQIDDEDGPEDVFVREVNAG